MKTDQQILNEIGLEQLKIIHGKEEYEPIKIFAENMIYHVESANSNVSYEQANKLLQYNGDDTIKLDEMLGYINRKVHRVGKCFSKRFLTKDRFSKCERKGTYSKLDVIIETQRILNKK